MKKNRNYQSGWWVVLLTATLAVPAMTEAGVGLYNSKLKQVTTSSTLKWANPRKEAMANYVVGSESEQGTVQSRAHKRSYSSKNCVLCFPLKLLLLNSLKWKSGFKIVFFSRTHILMQSPSSRRYDSRSIET